MWTKLLQSLGLIRSKRMRGDGATVQISAAQLAAAPFIASAESYYGRGEMNRAAEECERALKADPQSWRALSLRAMLYYVAEEWGKAEALFSRALDFGAPRQDAYRQRALARLMQGRREDALADCELAIRESPPNDETFLARGLIMLQLGRPVEAQSAWENSLRLNPGNHAASWNLATLEIDFGQYDRAVERLTALAAQFPSPSSADGEPLTSLPGNAEVHRNLRIDACGVHLQRARALVGLMQHDRAFEDLSLAAAHDPTNLRVIEDQALLHLQRDEIEQALADCDRMVRLAPCDEASYSLRAHVCYESSDLEGALADLQQAEIFADNPERIRLMRGKILCSGGRIEDARMVLDELLADNPADGEVLYLRAHCWRSLGLHREQRGDLMAALAVQPNDAKILNSLAWLYATCTDETIRDGRQAIHFGCQLVALTAARNPHYLDTLAAAYAEAGRADEACREMRRAIALFKVHPPPWGLDRYRQRLALFEQGDAYRE